MWHLRGIFVSGTYFALIWELALAVGCILVHMGKYVGSVCPFGIMVVWLILAVWQPYLCHVTSSTINHTHSLFKSPRRQSFSESVLQFYSEMVLKRPYCGDTEVNTALSIHCSVLRKTELWVYMIVLVARWSWKGYLFGKLVKHWLCIFIVQVSWETEAQAILLRDRASIL